jgi:hypothetical protein
MRRKNKLELEKENDIEITLSGLIRDRDYWKSRAEALERAVKLYGTADIICGTCVNHEGNSECNECRGNDSAMWKFDEARFAEGGEQNAE